MNFTRTNKMRKSVLLPYVLLVIISVLIVFFLFPKPVDSGLLRYLLFVFTFPVTAVITYFSLIEVVSSKYICFLFSITYSFLPWHFLKYNNLSVGFYGLLPYATTGLIMLTLDFHVPDFKNTFCLIIVDIILIFFQPMWGIVIFTVSVIFALYRIINRKKLNKWYILVCILPVISFVTNGAHFESYRGIGLVELFIPLENGLIKIFSNVYSYFIENLNDKLYNYSYLGIVLSLSLLYSFVNFFFLTEEDSIVNFCNIMIVFLLFFFLFRGLTAIIYYKYRSVNFESFIMIIAFLLCITGSRVLEKIKVHTNKFVFYGVSALVFFFNILSCIPTKLDNYHEYYHF